MTISKTIEYCWVVWAIKPGDIQLVAICTNRKIASNYVRNAKTLYPDHRLVMEEAPMDHLFGASDLTSVAFRTSMNRNN